MKVAHLSLSKKNKQTNPKLLTKREKKIQKCLNFSKCFAALLLAFLPPHVVSNSCDNTTTTGPTKQSPDLQARYDARSTPTMSSKSTVFLLLCSKFSKYVSYNGLPHHPSVMRTRARLFHWDGELQQPQPGVGSAQTNFLSVRVQRGIRFVFFWKLKHKNKWGE